MENLVESCSRVQATGTLMSGGGTDVSTKFGNVADEALPEEESPEQSKHIKALSDRHATIKTDLQRALSELAEKEDQLKGMEENAVRQREKTWLLEERIRLMTEKLSCLKLCMERKEKKQDSVFAELADVKWKIQESKKFMEKMKMDYSEMQRKKKQRQDQLAGLNNSQGEQASRARKELQDDIIRLTEYKLQYQRRDNQIREVFNGQKLAELEQRKRSYRDAIDERSAHSESLYLEIDEKSERVQRLKKSLETSKKQHQEMLRDRQNHYSYLAETELRLQRSLDYIRSKIDYGTYVPAPWPNLRESLRYKI